MKKILVFSIMVACAQANAKEIGVGTPDPAIAAAEAAELRFAREISSGGEGDAKQTSKAGLSEEERRLSVLSADKESQGEEKTISSSLQTKASAVVQSAEGSEREAVQGTSASENETEQVNNTSSVEPSSLSEAAENGKDTHLGTLVRSDSATTKDVVSSDQWVRDGWTQVLKGNLDGAINIWQAGVNALPDDYLLLFSGVYFPRNLAEIQLNKLGLAHAGIMIQAKYKGEKAWFVLSAPAKKDLPQAREVLSKFLGVNRVWANESRRYKLGTTKLVKHEAKQAQLSQEREPVQRVNRAQGDDSEVAFRKTAVQYGKKLSEIKTVKKPSVMKLREAKAVVLDSSSVLLFSRAKQALAQGHRDLAVADLAKLLIAEPKNGKARLMYGKLLVQEGKYAEAVFVLAELLDANGRDWRPWYWAGTANLMLGRLADATEDLSRAVALDGNNAVLWVQRAIVEQEKEHHQTALQLLEIARQIDPNLPEVELNIAYSSDALGLRKMADKAFGHFLVLTAADHKYTKVRQKVLANL